MPRILMLALAIASSWAIVAIWAIVAPGRAEARRVICEQEELLSRSPTVAVAEAPVRVPPLDTNFCVPGVGGDAGCRPHEPLPGPTGSSVPLLHDSFVLVKPPTLPPAPSQLRLLDRSRADALAAGHARNIDRPPRSA